MKVQLRNLVARRLVSSSTRQPQRQPQTWRFLSSGSVASASSREFSSTSSGAEKTCSSWRKSYTTNPRSVKTFAPLIAACSLAWILSSSKDKTARAEQDPDDTNPIDWNSVFQHKSDNDKADEDDEETTSCGCKTNKDEKIKEIGGDNGDDEDDNIDIPPYINEFARAEVGNSLNHNVTLLTKETKNILRTESQYPVERAELTMAPHVPPPIQRSYPVRLVVDIATVNKKIRIQGSKTFEFWPFAFFDYRSQKMKYGVPGPFIRARLGDILQVNHTNLDDSGMAHSIDFHCVCGPGGGSPTTFAEQDETRTGAYRLMKPGLYMYHCAASPIPQHIHNGMFGLILVEPEEGLPPVDKEFCVVQHEMYLTLEDPQQSKEFDMDYDAAAAEVPSHVFFNGRENSLIDKPLVVHQDETIRIYFGNAGPNLISSVHLIGSCFDKVYREGDIVSPPAKFVQTTLVPAGGSTVVDMKMQVPGNFALVDHSINRIDKGAVGFVKVKGNARPDIYDSEEPPRFCPGCKTHN